jgi:hypothetical protein
MSNSTDYFNTENGGRKFFGNVDICLYDHTVSHLMTYSDALTMFKVVFATALKQMWKN